jgi:hypothetical protein
MQLVKLSILGFIAGFLAVLIFHQSLWYLLNLVELIPLDRPAWPLDPIPPYGVPWVISKAFWGGAWGALLAPLLQGLTGRAYWAGWIIIGAVALSLVAFFVVPPIGRAHPGALAAFPRGPSRQRRVGSRHRLVPKAGADDPRLAKLSTDQARMKQNASSLARPSDRAFILARAPRLQR